MAAPFIRADLAARVQRAPERDETKEDQLWKEIENEWLLRLSGLLSIVLGLFLMVAPGAGTLALLWWVGATAIVFGALTIIVGFRLKGIKDCDRAVCNPWLDARDSDRDTRSIASWELQEDRLPTARRSASESRPGRRTSSPLRFRRSSTERRCRTRARMSYPSLRALCRRALATVRSSFPSTSRSCTSNRPRRTSPCTGCSSDGSRWT